MPFIPPHAQDDTPDSDTVLMHETKTKPKRPPMYKVLLLNDDYTPMEFVVVVLERFFGINHHSAMDLMMTVHKKGVRLSACSAMRSRKPR